MKPSSKPMAAAPTVFVVDDDPSMREAISRLIKSVGLNAETFSSAKEFLEYKREDVPACLVLDVRLKGQSGLELQRELVAKQSHPNYFYHWPRRYSDERAGHESGSR